MEISDLTPEFWKRYLLLLSESIKVDYTPTPRDFIKSNGWGAKRGNMGWSHRTSNWYQGGGKGYDVYEGSIVIEGKDNIHLANTIPLFEPMVKRVLLKIKTKQEAPKLNIKNTADKVLDQNKVAVKLAAKLSAGKAANSFFLNKILGKFPWYAKMFSKKNNMENNPLAKLVLAETAVTLSNHFATDSPKLKYIADAMLQEAMVDISVNSDILTKLIQEFEDQINLPIDL